MNINKYTITEKYTVKEAVEKMVKENVKAVVVLDENKKVSGLFANGDMRSFFLKGGALSDSIKNAMNKKPVLYNSILEAENAKKDIARVIYPVINESLELVSVIDSSSRISDEKVSDKLANVPLVIMAGGKGTRLYPYTKILPKPLIPIGDITITERIIDSFCKFGCKKVIMIVNYKANMIKSYMNELDKDYEIDFFQETEFLGTAGGLSLLKNQMKTTFFLSNCDILINDDLECAYKTHKKQENKITFICSMKNIVIPYGVVETDSNGAITNMKEKPDFSYLVNTGVYIIEPEVINEIKDNEVIHLPDLAKRMIDKGEKVGVFPIAENAWLDMGQYSEMKNMINVLENQQEKRV